MMELDSDVQQLAGHEGALLGVAFNKREGVTQACYSADLLIMDLVERDHMSVEDAIEYIEVNYEGAYSGPGGPLIIWDNSY